jgi:hypothetical protein
MLSWFFIQALRQNYVKDTQRFQQGLACTYHTVFDKPVDYNHRNHTRSCCNRKP